jgi:hypothetical protein
VQISRRATVVTIAQPARLFQVSYDPIDDELRVALSEAGPGLYVYEVDDGLYACVDEDVGVTHVCAERATLGRPPSWRARLADVVGPRVLATLDAVAVSGEPLVDRPLEVTPEELSRLAARWQVIVAEEAAGRAAVVRMPSRAGGARASAAGQPVRFAPAVRDRVARLADAIGATFEELRVRRTTLAPRLGFVEAPTRAPDVAAAVALDVRVDQAADVGLEPRGRLDVTGTSAELRLRVAGSRPRPPTVIAVMLDDEGVLAADPVLLAAEGRELAARFVLGRPVAPQNLRVIVLSTEW